MDLLKPSLVFLDENNSVKLGDFGLSKALAQASFANTYVGVGLSSSSLFLACDCAFSSLSPSSILPLRTPHLLRSPLKHRLMTFSSPLQTPYYMSPELMQEKAYDSKSDIWSLGCLIYELCALKPPFHEAKTHAELSVMIRNGRIPPLPKGYSPALGSIIKAMLNLNPAMRPSAQQLLQHERLDLAFKVSETQKMCGLLLLNASYPPC